MLFFKRILKLNTDGSERKEQRSAKRYDVGPEFPFKTALNLLGRDDDGNLLPPKDGRGYDWAVRLINLSGTGASMRMSRAAIAARAEECWLRISLDDFTMEIPAKVAHFRMHQNHATCGISFEFPDDGARNVYGQILETVVIGSSMEPVEDSKVAQDVKGHRKEELAGENGVRLSVWRDENTNEPRGFDYLLNDHGVQWSPDMGPPLVYAKGKKMEKLPPAQRAEVLMLFRLAVPNLPKRVPSDVRQFLLSCPE